MKYTLLHNNRCSKSRIGLKNLEDMQADFEVRYYLEKLLNKEELEVLQKKLGLKAIDFTRTGEKDFKESGLTKDSSDEDIINAMIAFPKLIERPIVYNDEQAVIGRPPENIINFLNR